MNIGISNLQFETIDFTESCLSYCRPSFTFTARSNLPIGAGLGSSASYSACLATTFLLLHGRISIPCAPAPSRLPEPPEDLGHMHASHGGRRALPKPFADEVNRWTFILEKVSHGNPSDVDNSVAVYGGALASTCAGFGRKSGLESIQGYIFHTNNNFNKSCVIFRFKSIRFLITDSKVPRDTKSLVAGVGAFKERVLTSSLNLRQGWHF